MNDLQDLLARAWHLAPDDATRASLARHVADFLNPPATPTVTKALLTTSGTIAKAWQVDDDVFYEGWLSTPDRDLQREITEPEAFVASLPSYFERSAPVSYQHGMDFLPAGHLQKAVILRNGQPLLTAEHPTDSADFEHLPSSGSGVWVRGRLTEEPVKSSVRKGNTGGMSFVGSGTSYEPLPDGGRRWLTIDPLMESTVAPFPINPKAAIKIAKAFGLSDEDPTQETQSMDLDELLKLAAKEKAEAEAKAQEEQVQKGFSAADLATLFEQMTNKLMETVDEKVAKAAIPERGEGTGRKGTVPAPEKKNPVAELIAKAQRGEEFSIAEKDLAFRLTQAALTHGLKDSDDDTLDLAAYAE